MVWEATKEALLWQSFMDANPLSFLNFATFTR